MATAARRPSSRDREEYARGTARARRQLARTADEIAGVVSAQVRDLIVDGDVLGGRELFLGRLQSLLEAERRGDADALRSAVVDMAGAAGAWAAALDYGATAS